MTDEEAGKPKYLSDDLRNAQTVSDKDATIGINAAEAADADSIAKGLVTPGWVKYTTYTDQHGNTRHKSEVLVAAGSMGSDGTETLADDLGGGTAWTVLLDGYNQAYFTGTVLQVGNNYNTFAPLPPGDADLIRSLQVGDTIRIAGYITPTETYDRVITAITEAVSGSEGQFQIYFDGGLPHSTNGAEGTVTSISKV
jgi:hypothetical protein